MRCDCNDRDNAFAWAVVKKDSIRGRSFVFYVGFENLFAVMTPDTRIFMGIQTRMFRIDFKQPKSFKRFLVLLGVTVLQFV